MKLVVLLPTTALDGSAALASAPGAGVTTVELARLLIPLEEVPVVMLAETMEVVPDAMIAVEGSAAEPAAPGVTMVEVPEAEEVWGSRASRSDARVAAGRMRARR